MCHPAEADIFTQSRQVDQLSRKSLMVDGSRASWNGDVRDRWKFMIATRKSIRLASLWRGAERRGRISTSIQFAAARVICPVTWTLFCLLSPPSFPLTEAGLAPNPFSSLSTPTPHQVSALHRV
jgi:hypothetical protein